ncbi:MAG TPA: PAS domain-containing sensor histidine kinase [Anaerolineales bacterium]|nr:PAS domain-containing sensor histidine kinase [Anaerolineales bacterium]
MDEKTIPLPRPSLQNIGNSGAARTVWGDDLHYRALFEQTGECVFIIGLDFRYLTANQQALGLLGYEEHELIGKPVSDVMTQDDALGRQSRVGERTNLFERILKRKDGTTLPVEVSTSVVYNELGQPSYIQSIARDISEWKHAEWILKRQAQILSVIGDATARLLRSSSIEIKIPEVLESLGIAMDVDCCAIFEINTFFADPSVQVRYQWMRETIDARDVGSFISACIPQLLSTSNGRSSFRDMDHQSASFSNPTLVAIPINGGLGSSGFLGFLDSESINSWSVAEFDAAQTAANLIGSALLRNRYEETIRLNDARNRIILGALPDLLIRIDTYENILDYSANSEHPLYIDRDLIIDRKLSQIWPEDIVEKIIGKVNQQTFRTRVNVEEFRLPHSNHAFEARLYPISTVEALIVIRDITEQAKLNEMKSDFINRASHELRTPLTAAMLMTELIQEGGTPEEVDEYWRTLKSELNRQKILIDRLLIAGRLESGMMKLEIVPLDLLPVLEESIMAVKAIANKRNISLQLELFAKPVTILGDKSGLQQVFINLINNAAKFSRQGGTVKILLSESEEHIDVCIRDDGVGIPTESIPYLFQRFYRAKNVTIAEIPGSGIGLYIVKSIVDELGGKITVKSELNQGTTFIVSLKRHRADSGA